jgi:phosphatidylglycerophosphate synthase
MARYRAGSRWSAFYLATARGFTLARLASIPLFLFLLVQTSRAGPQQWRMSLLLLYVCIALSDFLDGRLARKAGAPSHLWGQVDATADIAFTSLSLATAAWLGRVGPWVPIGVAVLGGRFLLRNLRHQPTLPGRLIEDRAGKAAGVIYYLLVGAVALDLSVAGEGGQWLIARAGDAVFVYTLFLLLRRRKGRPSPSDP